MKEKVTLLPGGLFVCGFGVATPAWIDLLVISENVLRDVIAPALEKVKVEWHGFHAFRRGLATNLRSLGVDDLTIKEILRHSDVSVTRASYIKRIDEKSVEAMDRFEAELRKPVQSVKGKTRKADTVVPVGMA